MVKLPRGIYLFPGPLDFQILLFAWLTQATNVADSGAIRCDRLSTLVVPQVGWQSTLVVPWGDGLSTLVLLWGDALSTLVLPQGGWLSTLVLPWGDWMSTLVLPWGDWLSALVVSQGGWLSTLVVPHMFKNQADNSNTWKWRLVLCMYMACQHLSQRSFKFCTDSYLHINYHPFATSFIHFILYLISQILRLFKLCQQVWIK